MNCPKCGFVQEERADCRKCGVVFAKFLAFHAPESAPAFMGQDPPSNAGISYGEQSPSDASQLHEIKQSLHNLEQRFRELEFERAERRRLHGEMRALDERLKQGLAQVTDCQEEIRLHAAKLAELPPAPALQDFSALQMEVRALDILSLQQRIERVEDRIESCTQAQRHADLSALETVSGLDSRLVELENRPPMPAEPQGPVLESDALTRLDAALKAIDDLRTSLQTVTMRYSEIGELKKNHLVLHDMFESLQRTADDLKKDPANGTAGKTEELKKEVSALKAEVRKNYERIEMLEAHFPSAGAQIGAMSSQELLSLREDFAAAGTQNEEDRREILSRLESVEANVGESLAALAELPSHMEAFRSQICLLDQQYQQLSGTLSQLSKAVHGIPQKTTELNRLVEQMGQEYLEMRVQIRALEGKTTSPGKPPSDVGSTHPPGDMHVIQENLDEIRHFMADLSRKL